MKLTYDGGGSRAIKSVLGGTTTFYVGSHFEVSQSGTGTETTRFIFAGNLRIAQIKDGATSFFHKDHLGSSTIMSNINGSPLETSEYLPFGGQRTYTGSAVSNYKFTDQEFDPESGLYNYNARLYDPVLGKFVTADTIVPDPSSPQTLNRYSYCYNNPLVYVDPDGHFGFIVSAIVGAIIGGVQAELSGGDFWEGAITGAVSGALFFGAGELVVNAGVNSFIAHTGAGMLSGGINAGITGGDIGMGIITGGISGGIGEFGGGILSDYGFNSFGEQFIGRSLIGGVTGGITSEISGGSFSDGFSSGLKTAAYGYLFNHMTHEGYSLWQKYQARQRLIQHYKDFLESIRPNPDGARDYVNWHVDRSGVKTELPAVLVSSAAVGAGGVIGFLYEPLIISMGTPAGQRVMDFGRSYVEHWSGPTNWIQTAGANASNWATEYGPRWMHPLLWD